MAFYGGPLNASRVEVADIAAARIVTDGGHYVLVDGAYYWHVGEPAVPTPSETPDLADSQLSASGTPAAPRARTRARRRPATD